MIWEPFMLALGFLLLIKGSDFLVEAASRIAKKLGVPEFVIGLTLVAVGTSVPELASSIAASTNGYDELIIGNLVGSNMANIGLILGIAAIITTIKIDRTMLKRDGYIMVGAVVLFYIFALTGMIRWYMGIVFLLLYLAYVMFLIKTKDSHEEHEFRDFVSYFFKLEYLITVHNHAVRRIREGWESRKRGGRVFGYQLKIYEAFKEGLVKDLLIVALSLVAIVFGAEYLVSGAMWLAGLLHMSSGLIGLSVVAIGTSLPELSVSITAAIKRYGDLAVGNIIGSNIANLFLIMGICTMINPLSIDKRTLYFVGPFTILISVILVMLLQKHDHKISREHGIALLAMYLTFMAFMFWRG
jgi:cation:H+ antiporter